MKHFTRPIFLLALLLLGTTCAWAQNNTIDLATVTANTIVQDGETLTGTLDVANYPVKISIADGATVTLDNVTIIGEDDDSYPWGGITCEGVATLILVGTNTLSGFEEHYPGIYVPENCTLTLQGTGSLNAIGKSDSAGIGGGNSRDCGNIVIAGGIITATAGGVSVPGIGVGINSTCGTISISGGTVTATGGLYGPAIGAGYKASCGAISISGGTVTAQGGNYAAGIGAGYDHSSCVSIDITGGIVTATGGTNAAGIGSGQESSCGAITITDGVTQVTATRGSDNVPSIGKGGYGTCGTVTIGGVVYPGGIMQSPYRFPNYTLTNIPSGWTVTADGQSVTPTDGKASIPSGATVVLTPTDNDKPRVKNITLIDPLTIPLTFEAKEDGAVVTFTKASTLPNLSIEYSLNGGAWTTYTTSITLTNIGDKVSFRGDNANYGTGFEDTYSSLSCTGSCYIYGNIMSLIDSDDYATSTELTELYTFTRLFKDNTNLYNHPSKPLLLPATTLPQYCYSHMFQGCTHLTTAPELPATTLDQYCYRNMFEGCTSLTTAPELPATTLAASCYSFMFKDCTSLTTAPELPATTLVQYCYRNMFEGCTSLTTAPALPATTLAPYCYPYMFDGCTSLTTASALPATTLTLSCYSCMFKGCTQLTTAPALPATTLAENCYNGMFHGCTSLTTAPELPATTLERSCYKSMFNGCTALTTAPVLPATTLDTYCYIDMFNGCSSLNKVTCLATNPSPSLINNSFTKDWLKDVASTGTFIKPGLVNDWAINSPNGIPVGWTTNTYELFLPLTFEAMAAPDGGTKVSFTAGTDVVSSLSPIEYSKNGGAWTLYTYGTDIILDFGDKVSFRGNNATYATSFESGKYSNFSCSDDCYIYGNVMSLIDKNNFATNTTLDVTTSCSFCKLFFNNTHIFNHDSKPLLLPATILNVNCYNNMFYGCSNLTQAPALPATTLANGCYTGMFNGCHLTEAPELHATTLALSCYFGMFSGCTYLTTAPALPATTLASNCYQNMFSGCTSLTTAPVLPATTLADYCYAYMFQNCTSLTTAPELPAPTLELNCYCRMFLSCTHLNQVTCLATSGINSNNSTTDWLHGVATKGTFNKPETAIWTLNSVSGIPQGWIINGVLPGKFTVNGSGGKVYFSQGNLQATTSDLGANWTWSFAEHQYDYIGSAAANTSINGNGTVSTNGTVDLFGWVGASSTWTGAAQYGISKSTATYNTDGYGNVVDETLKSDWGTLAITNGGNTANSGWRTLSIEEWNYLFRTRTTVSGHHFVKAIVNNVNGVILLPDDWSTSYHSLNYYDSDYDWFERNIISDTDWINDFEAHGAVFLPAGGLREGKSVFSEGLTCLYWSSSPYVNNGGDVGMASSISCSKTSLNINTYGNRYRGYSVRLVKDVN